MRCRIYRMQTGLRYHKLLAAWLWRRLSVCELHPQISLFLDFRPVTGWNV